MRQPPPYGSGQPGPYGPQGYGQPGYGPPPGYPPPGYGAPMGPPKKKRTGLIVGIVAAVVVLLGAGIPLGIFASDYFASTGAAPVSSPVPAECQVPAPVLEKAGYPSFAGAAPGSDVAGLKQVACGWKPGPGENVRDATLSVRINAYSGANAQKLARELFEPRGTDVPPVDVPNLGDRAVLVRLITKSAFSGAELHVLTGATVVIVEVSGWDKGFFSNSPMPQDESDGTVQAVAAEIVK